MSGAETKAMLAVKNARHGLERISALEATVQGIITATNNALGEMEGRVMGLAEVVDALVDSQGPEAINSIVAEKRRYRRAAKQEQEQMAIKEGTLNGTLKAAAVASETSVIVFKECDETGKELEFSRTQSAVVLLVPKVRAEILGKGVGYKVNDEGSKHTYEVMEIYDPVQKAPEVPAATAAPATEAPPAAPEPTPEAPPAEAPAAPAAPTTEAVQ